MCFKNFVSAMANASYQFILYPQIRHKDVIFDMPKNTLFIIIFRKHAKEKLIFRVLSRLYQNFFKNFIISDFGIPLTL